MLLDDLRQSLATRPSRVIFIVGTGVTVGALHGSPHEPVGTWAGLLGDGLRRVHELGTLDAPTLAHYQQQLGLSFPEALLGVANVVSHGLGAPHGGEFSRWLRETVGAFHDDIRDRAVLDALAEHQRRGVLLATTNYDHLLVTATALRPTTWRRVASVERAIGGTEPRILHLHGEWEDPDSIVLGMPSYVDVGRDAHAQAVLTALRTDRTFVFVGCGAGLRDPNLGAFLNWTGKTFGRAEGRHFRLCRGSEVEALRREHPPDQRIFPISYGDSHADLAPFLRALLSVSESTIGNKKTLILASSESASLDQSRSMVPPEPPRPESAQNSWLVSLRDSLLLFKAAMLSTDNLLRVLHAVLPQLDAIERTEPRDDPYFVEAGQAAVAAIDAIDRTGHANSELSDLFWLTLAFLRLYAPSIGREAMSRLLLQQEAVSVKYWESPTTDTAIRAVQLRDALSSTDMRMLNDIREAFLAKDARLWNVRERKLATAVAVALLLRAQFEQARDIYKALWETGELAPIHLYRLGKAEKLTSPDRQDYMYFWEEAYQKDRSIEALRQALSNSLVVLNKRESGRVEHGLPFSSNYVRTSRPQVMVSKEDADGATAGRDAAKMDGLVTQNISQPDQQLEAVIRALAEEKIEAEHGPMFLAESGLSAPSLAVPLSTATTMSHLPTTFPQPLLDAYRDHRLGILFGSGLSLATDVVGNFPRWEHLPARLLDIAEKQCVWTPKQINSKREFFKEHVSLEAMLSELDSIKGALGGLQGYRAALASLFRPKREAPGDVHHALAALDIDAVLTTNYDRLFESVDRTRVAYTWQQASHALGDIQDGRSVLFKIHGSAEDNTSVVLTYAEYIAAAADVSYQNTMRVLLQSYTFLLVGYGINDPLDLDLVFSLNKRSFGSASRRHYALMPKTVSSTDRDRWDRDLNIQVILYEDHGDLPTILREFAKISTQ